MQHTLLSDNTVQSPLYSDGMTLTFANNIVAGNSYGGLLLNLNGSDDMNIINNVFYGNTFVSGGGAALFSKPSSVDFTNNIVAENTAVGGYFYPGGSYAADYNDFYHNTLGDSTSAVGTGNLAVDPAFTDAAGGDFSLRAGYSSCINAGDPTIDDPDGSRSDMGAYGGEGGDW